MKKTLAALCTSLLAGCAVPAVENNDNYPLNHPFIVNGYEASYRDFKSIGALTDEDGTYAFCTGSFIKKDAFLTAAHCLDYGALSNKFILCGYDQVFEEPCKECVYPLAAGKVHPEYHYHKYNEPGENWYDLALLLLEEEIPDVEPIPILKLHEFETALRIGNMVTIAGYGAYGEYDNVKGSGKLYAADVPITGRPNEDEIMLGGEELSQGDACYGDSGGPAYVYAHGRVQLTGVTSRSPPGSVYKCGEGTIYTLPGRYVDWIEDTYKELREEYPLKKPKKPVQIDNGVEAVPVSEETKEDLLYPSGGCQLSLQSRSTSSFFFVSLLAGYFLRRRKN